MAKEKKSDRRQLSRSENNYLWMISGGICSFEGCNKRLVETSAGSLTNVGIIAHIIGHAKNSARHEYMEEYEFTQDTLEDVKNLMLMCHYHSKLIDDNHTRDQFPPELLFKMKNDHERWISSRTNVEKKKSIAIIHKRIGGPISDIEYEGDAPFILLDAVENQLVFDDFTIEGWEKGKKQNEELYQAFLTKIEEKDADVGEIYPLSPIPLLIHLGSLLTDTVPYSIYQFDRERGIWAAENPEGGKTSELTYTTEIRGHNVLAVRISVSGIVKPDSVAEVLDGLYDTVSFEIDNPNLKRVLYKEDVIYIQATIKAEVEKLLQEQDYDKIHLFYAGPAGLAIEIGRGINTNIWSEVCLYQYNNRETPRYKYALSV